MAQIYTWDLQGWRDSYSTYLYIQKECGAKHVRICKCTGRIETYSRKFFTSMAMFTVRARNIVNQLQLAQGSKILVIGVAFGFLMEELEKLGMIVYGLDNSHYIHQQINLPKNPQKVKYPIKNIDATSSTFVNEVHAGMGVSQFDCIITEDVLTSHDTFNEIFDNCESVLHPSKPLSRIVHLVDLTPGEQFTRKSSIEWVASRSTHTWVDTAGVLLNANN